MDALPSFDLIRPRTLAEADGARGASREPHCSAAAPI